MDTASDAGCMSLRMRPSMTLDLGASRVADPASDAVLSSPDVRLLKLATPELERLVLQQYRHHHHHHQHQQQQQNSSKDRQLTLDVAVTEEDARGFVDVQLEVHGQRHHDFDPAVIRSTTQTSTPAARCSIATEVGLPRSVDLCQAGEPISFNTPPMSPRPSNNEDRARLERKRARNRLAASRCRNRKLERIEQLQRQADRLRADNAKLADDVRHLRDIVGQLRRDVLLHVACQPDISSMSTPFDS